MDDVLGRRRFAELSLCEAEQFGMMCPEQRFERSAVARAAWLVRRVVADRTGHDGVYARAMLLFRSVSRLDRGQCFLDLGPPLPEHRIGACNDLLEPGIVAQIPPARLAVDPAP